MEGGLHRQTYGAPSPGRERRSNYFRTLPTTAGPVNCSPRLFDGQHLAGDRLDARRARRARRLDGRSDPTPTRAADRGRSLRSRARLALMNRLFFRLPCVGQRFITADSRDRTHRRAQRLAVVGTLELRPRDRAETAGRPEQEPSRNRRHFDDLAARCSAFTAREFSDFDAFEARRRADALRLFSRLRSTLRNAAATSADSCQSLRYLSLIHI